MRLLWISADGRIVQEPSSLEALAGVQMEAAGGAWEGLERLRTSVWDAVVACFPLPDSTVEEFLEQAQRIDPWLPLIVRNAKTSLADAVRLTRLGAWDCFDDRRDWGELASVLEAAMEHGSARQLAVSGNAASTEPWRRLLVGRSRAMESLGHIVRLVGPRRSTVLISGETGVGKEMVARAMHSASPRSHLQMVAVNCNALPENLLEAELFGHVKGAFTGAINQRVGRFEQAHRSTLFLDEIGDLSIEIQAKLLRVLQEREFQRIGSSETIQVDVRVIAATNIDLAQAVRQRNFREDLFYRLNVVPVRVPPLRDRRADIPVLVHHFIDKICRQEELPPRHVSRETLTRLCHYTWPGNVRQLENAVEMAIALSGDRETLYPGDFPLPPAAPPRAVAITGTPVMALPDEGLDFEEIVSGLERSILRQALRRANGNKAQAAEMLRLKRTTLAAKLKSLDVESEETVLTPGSPTPVL